MQNSQSCLNIQCCVLLEAGWPLMLLMNVLSNGSWEHHLVMLLTLFYVDNADGFINHSTLVSLVSPQFLLDLCVNTIYFAWVDKFGMGSHFVKLLFKSVNRSFWMFHGWSWPHLDTAQKTRQTVNWGAGRNTAVL